MIYILESDDFGDKDGNFLIPYSGSLSESYVSSNKMLLY